MLSPAWVIIGAGEENLQEARLSMIDYGESPARSAELLRMVVPHLARLRLPLDPINYALWYEYYLGRNDVLNARLDEIAEGKVAYSPGLASKLFYEHILNAGPEQVDRVGAEVRSLLSELMTLFSETRGNIDRQTERLEESSRNLEAASESTEITDLVAQIVAQTREIVATNREFNARLNETTAEANRLREDLERIRAEAATDPLTGLANRKTFDEALESALSEARVSGGEVSLLMVDVDFFKKINDEHGHLVGDKVLKFLAATLRQTVKGRDLVARYGGEEFAVILRDTPCEDGVRVAESIRAAVETAKLKRTGTEEELGRITVSVGVGSSRNFRSPEGLIGAADQALYVSKRNGRNRVTAACQD